MKNTEETFFKALKTIEIFLLSIRCEENCTKQVTNTLASNFYFHLEFFQFRKQEKQQENPTKKKGKAVLGEKSQLKENVEKNAHEEK